MPAYTGTASLVLVRHGESTWIEEGRFQGRGDPPLSAWGLRQARAVAERLAHPDAPPGLPLPPGAPVAVWHSPLERAAATARALSQARRHDAPMVALDELVELAQGAWEGLSHDQVRERYPEELAAWRSDPLHHHAPGGESLVSARERARAAAARIIGALGAASLTLGAPEGAWQAPQTPGTGAAEPVLGYEQLPATSVMPGPPGSPTATASGAAWGVVVAHDGILRLLMLDLLGVPTERYWSFPFALASVTVLELRDGLVRLRAHNIDGHIAALSRA